MRTHTFDDYTMTLHDTGRKGEYGKARVAYTFTSPQGIVLFEGEDLFPSPMYDPEGRASAVALLSFLTLKKGDTDEEYFEKYTPAQLEFSESMDCENLSLYTLEEAED